MAMARLVIFLRALVLLGLLGDQAIRAVDLITAINESDVGGPTRNPVGRLVIALRVVLASLKLRISDRRDKDKDEQRAELLSIIYGTVELSIACISVFFLLRWEWDMGLLISTPSVVAAAARSLGMERWAMFVGELLLAVSELYQPPFKSKWVGIPYMVAGFANAKLGGDIWAAIPAFVRISVPGHALLECGLLPRIVGAGVSIFATGHCFMHIASWGKRKWK